jgi:putative transposase
VLSEHGIKIAPSTYYDNVSRKPSKRALRDAEIVGAIKAERSRQKLFARFGARKMWLHLRSKGIDVARCTIERLYAEQGWAGALRAKKVRTTIPDENAQRPADLVDRQFVASRPNQLWVADFTYVATWSGMVYVAFIFDVFSRRIVGWRTATRMTTKSPSSTQCGPAARPGSTTCPGWCTTPMRGQYVSFAYTKRLIKAGVDASVGSVGDAYGQCLGRIPDRALQDRADSPPRTLARRRTRRAGDPELRRLVQHRASARVRRRPHTSQGR